MLKLKQVWIPYAGINQSDYPGVNWSDKAAVMADKRLGYFVDVPVYGVDDDELKTALADGDVTADEISGTAAPVIALGALALLFML